MVATPTSLMSSWARSGSGPLAKPAPLEAVARALAGLILAVAGIGIMNVLLAAVIERAREIGIRKAIGALSCDIQAQFLIASVTVTRVGSVLGFMA